MLYSAVMWTSLLSAAAAAIISEKGCAVRGPERCSSRSPFFIRSFDQRDSGGEYDSVVGGN